MRASWALPIADFAAEPEKTSSTNAGREEGSVCCCPPLTHGWAHPTHGPHPFPPSLISPFVLSVGRLLTREGKKRGEEDQPYPVSRIKRRISEQGGKFCLFKSS